MSEANPRKREIDEETVRKGLDPTSSTTERLMALREVGLLPFAIRNALGVTEATLRNWQNGMEPREVPRTRLDAMRNLMRILFESEVPLERAVNWAQSSISIPPYKTPLELVANHPEDIYRAASALSRKFEEQS